MVCRLFKERLPKFKLLYLVTLALVPNYYLLIAKILFISEPTIIFRDNSWETNFVIIWSYLYYYLGFNKYYYWFYYCNFFDYLSNLNCFCFLMSFYFFFPSFFYLFSLIFWMIRYYCSDYFFLIYAYLSSFHCDQNHQNLNLNYYFYSFRIDDIFFSF